MDMTAFDKLKEITLFVTYDCKAGMRGKFLDEVKSAGLIDKIRLEDGFVSYDYFLSADDPDKLLLVEKWGSQKQQKAHLETAHMGELKMIKEKYVADTQVEIF